MKKLTFIFLASLIMASCGSRTGDDFDYIDAYDLAIGETHLFGDMYKYVDAMGLPERISIGNSDFQVTARKDIDSLITIAGDTSGNVALHYPGIEMETWDGDIVPTAIDFRKTDRRVTYGEVIFDGNYTERQFEELFPNSVCIQKTMQMPSSLFEIKTGDKSANYNHYLVNRKSKDNPTGEDSDPMVEFTFSNGKLIYIFFANF